MLCARPDINFTSVGQLSSVAIGFSNDCNNGSCPSDNVLAGLGFRLNGTMHDPFGSVYESSPGQTLLPAAKVQSTSFLCDYSTDGPAVSYLLCQVDRNYGLVSRLDPFVAYSGSKSWTNNTTTFSGHTWLFWDLRDACPTYDEACAAGAFDSLGGELTADPSSKDGAGQIFDLNRAGRKLGSLGVTMCYDTLLVSHLQ